MSLLSQNSQDKHVLLLIDSLGSGGAQRQILLLARLLAVRGFSVEILIYHNTISYDLKDSPFKVTFIQKGNLVVLLWRVFRHLSVSRPAALIAYLRGPTLIARLMTLVLPKMRVITSRRNVDISFSRIQQLVERLTYRFSDCIVTNTFSEQHALSEHVGIPAANLRVIYNGYDEARFAPISGVARQMLRKSLGFEADKFYVLLPGRIQQQKNHRALIEAVRGLHDKGRLKVVFVGEVIDKELFDELKAMIAADTLEDVFVFKERQENIEDFYHAADVVVLPSLWEGLPNVVIEAMACGRPVIASDVSDNSKIIEHGRSGYLFPVSSVDELRLLIERALAGGIHEDLGGEAHRRIAKLCSSNALADAYIECIEGR